MGRAKTGTVMRWCVQDEVNQAESEHDEVDGMKKEADSIYIFWMDEHIQHL